MVDKDWAPGVYAGLGMFLLALVVDATGQLIPCIGWIFPTLVAIVGIGGLLLTRFGSQPYPPEVVAVEGAVVDIEPSEDIE